MKKKTVIDVAEEMDRQEMAAKTLEVRRAKTIADVLMTVSWEIEGYKDLRVYRCPIQDYNLSLFTAGIIKNASEELLYIMVETKPGWLEVTAETKDGEIEFFDCYFKDTKSPEYALEKMCERFRESLAKWYRKQ